MHILYVDNFRGFESTFLTLKHVNFFVGENSTGKTSILKLINILSSPSFWLHGTFGDNLETRIGIYSDLITSGSSKDFFEVGILCSRNGSPSNLTAIKMKFIDYNSQPYLKEICYFDGSINLQISIEGTFIKYRYEILQEQLLSKDHLSFFKRWISNNDLNHKKLNKHQVNIKGISSILFHTHRLISLNELRNNKQQGITGYETDLPLFLNNCIWIGSNRLGPRAIYPDVENAIVPLALKRLIDSEIPLVKLIFQKFGLDSGLFGEIEVAELDGKEDLEKLFEIRLKSQGKDLTINNVGFGVSQILPLIVLPLNDSKLENQSSWFAIQAPEIHLHPKAQAAYGEFIYKCYERDRQSFIIETHSDYTIDRFRLRINKAFKDKLISDPGSISQIVFFSAKQNRNKLDFINIQEDGSYSEEQPKEFRDFFIREKFDLLNI